MMQPTFVRFKCTHVSVHVSEQQIALTKRGLETPLGQFFCVEFNTVTSQVVCPHAMDMACCTLRVRDLSRTDVVKL
jgi:hypothetical protein